MNDPRAGLQSLINPSSVAIIGASDNPARIGGRPLRYLIDLGYKGTFYPVNPNRETVQGVKAYSSIKDVGQPVDCALVAVPAKLVLETLEDCAASGVKSAVIFSSGFAEVGDAGALAQDELTAFAKRTGMRLLGPNCLGVLNFHSRFFATFSSTGDQGYPEPGPLAIISQSGAYGTHLFAVAKGRGIGVSHVITTGNECDVSVAECIDWAVDNDDIKVIAAYVEGVKDGAALIRSFEKARARKKPVILLKVGQSEEGAAAAASHTASLAGADEIYDAVFRQYGVYRAETTEDMLDAAYACTAGIFPKANRVGLVTISGGVGAQMADHAVKLGLDVAPMPEDAQKLLKEYLPFASSRNPVDTTAQFFNDMKLVGLNFDIMLDKGGYDSAVAFFTLAACSPYVVEPLLKELDAIRSKFPDRLLILSLVGSEDMVATYSNAGYLIFEDPCRAIGAIAALTRIGEAFVRPPMQAAPDSKALPEAAIPARDLSEWESRNLLSAAGLPVVEAVLCAIGEEAADAARGFDRPVAMKINGARFAHKTEIGGVMLGIETPEAARAAFVEITERTEQAVPGGGHEGVIVAPMVSGGVETILGVQIDPVFGPAVMFGLGGVFVEVFKDVSFRLAPFDKNEALQMIGETKGAKLLRGVRGRPAADIDALAEALVCLSRFASDHADKLQSIDLNPFVVLPEGQGCLALDCLVVPEPAKS
ncbi:acetate--CoA ligase family protein [Thalassospiraceae bacterium LMO-JJ14]|nr:acetate--CoA ligase family protein [Thalassospiraceae bacterium LMO-JJ14]